MTERLLDDCDDEVDIEMYRRYLCAQDDDDLSDIAAHVDADNFPARCAAVRREMARRHLWTPPPLPPELFFNRWSPEQAFADPDDLSLPEASLTIL